MEKSPTHRDAADVGATRPGWAGRSPCPGAGRARPCAPDGARRSAGAWPGAPVRHHPANALAPDAMPLGAQMAAAAERRLQEVHVDQAHQRRVQRAFARPRPVSRRPADPDQRAWPRDRRRRRLRLDHLPPPGHAHRPEAIPSRTCRFQAAIAVWRKPCLIAGSAIVASPRTASSLPFDCCRSAVFHPDLALTVGREGRQAPAFGAPGPQVTELRSTM